MTFLFIFQVKNNCFGNGVQSRFTSVSAIDTCHLEMFVYFSHNEFFMRPLPLIFPMKTLHVLTCAILLIGCKPSVETIETIAADTLYGEKFRPQLHFSPKEKWMNDPNGMVFHDGQYHLFYQYYPDSTVWGPMHWGHAITKDLIHWEHLPVAIYPDSLGLIFSGSAVVDKQNTSGLGTTDNPPLVAIYTYHSMEKEKKGRTDYQTQGMAYSTDGGTTWVKYAQNPIVKNPGIKDFRDPKVMWHEPTRRWVMTLAAQDHIEFYGSPDLKNWDRLGEFGKNSGAHGGVWECPDLFQLATEDGSQKKWVLLVSINPGGPNGGSATQYFVGDFDGKKFTATKNLKDTTWLDYGPDNYAGVTWSNAPDNRRIFLGWMSNWAYANVVPTEKWRGATTCPRDLSLVAVGDKLIVASRPSPEVKQCASNASSDGGVDSTLSASAQALSLIEGQLAAKDFEIQLSNSKNQQVIIGYDSKGKRFYVDRGNSGQKDFSAGFNAKSFADRISDSPEIQFTVITDVSSVEIFFDNGLSVMTSTFFPDEPFTKMIISSEGNPVDARGLKVTRLMPIW
jgi:fructan beta-fructosidase